MLSVKSKKSNQILLEGRRLIQDAINVGIIPEKIFYTRKKDLDKLNNLEELSGVQLFKIPYKDMQLWSGLTTCPGILAICKKPNIIEKKDNCIPVTVVCDQVREPGNLGAIIRCAAGAGIEKVLLTKGCADLWDSKVLRGASGAHFHLPVINDITWETFSDYIGPDVNFLLAVNQPLSVYSVPCYPYHSIDYKNSKETVIVIGGETEGLSESVYRIANEFKGKAINIPLANNVESLNCVSAMSVILFEIKRQLCS
ncbi:hypothetical protein O3M35_010882 [Rhynocoris fuscipes]|uniref:RNA 2-O ribose methyltransferase substrate binding domain-containing protein n=1 Tax=Rhynocoris fuscipes TaxID=488301 RepID=A0AAW1D1Z7_9HEMI